MRPKVDRAEEVLKALVERYTRDGEPVGSRAIAESHASGHFICESPWPTQQKQQLCFLMHSKDLRAMTPPK